MKNSIPQKLLSIFLCIALVLIIFNLNMFVVTTAAESSSDWYNASDLRAVQVKTNEIVLLVYVRNSTEMLHISFPSNGGLRVFGSQEGIFSPDSIQNIRSENMNNVISAYGSDIADVTVKINRNVTPWEMEIQNSNGIILTSFSGEQICFKKKTGAITDVSIEGKIHNNEFFYGLGELFDGYYLNGTTRVLWNKDCWSDEESTYKSIPILHSTNGYMLYYNSTYKAVADIGATDSEKYSLVFNGPILDFYIWCGEPLDNISSYCSLTGNPVLPPKWAFQYWAGAASTAWEASGKDNAINLLDDTINGYKNIGISSLAALYGEDTLVNIPEAYSKLKNTNTKLLAWCNPFVTTESISNLMPELNQNISASELPRLKNINGLSYHSSDMIDFTHTNAKSLVSKLWDKKIKDGIKGIMVDYCEYVPEDCTASNGMTGSQLHNLYSYFYSKTMYDEFKKINGDDFILFARSAAAGSQKWAANFGGDQTGDFTGLRKAVIALLTFSSCGFSTWGADIGGLSTTISEEVYMRWLQFGSMNPLMRLHGQSLGDPWCYSDKAIQCFKNYYWLRENLLNKIYSSAISANLSGKPMSQSMSVAFPKQKSLIEADSQYIFCDDFLVCPVTTANAYSDEVSFPQGNWVDLWTGEIINGGIKCTVDAPTDRSPLFIRGGSAIPVTVNKNGYSLADPFDDESKSEALIVTPPNGTRTSEYYTSTDKCTSYTVSSISDRSFEIKSSDSQNMQSAVILYGVNATSVEIDGKPVKKLENSSNSNNQNGYFVDGSLRTVVLTSGQGWNNITVTVGGAKGENLALNAQVDSTGVINPQFLTDGEITSNSLIDLDSDTYITIDIGENKRISSVVVKWLDNHNCSYNIKSSCDGITWDTLSLCINYNEMINTIKFTPLNARYIRFDGFDTQSLDKASIYEINVCSEEASELLNDFPILSKCNDYSVYDTQLSEAVKYYPIDFPQQMKAYHGDTATTNGLTSVEYNDYYTIDGKATHTYTALGSFSNYWESQNDIVTTSVYTGRQYRDFDMTITMKTDSGGWDIVPKLLFGIENPNDWINKPGGGYAVGVYNEGRSFIQGIFNNKFDTLSDPQAHNEESTVNKGLPELYGFVGYWYGWYTVNVRVEGKTVTVRIGQAQDWITNPNYVYTYQLDDIYTGGYVGFATPSGVCSVHSFSITDLGGTVLSDVSNDLTNKKQVENLFDVYSSNSAKEKGLVKKTVDECFSFSKGVMENKFDINTVTDYWEEQDDFITSAIYSGKKYRNFEMEISCVGTENRVQYYWPMLVFGIQDPTIWVTNPTGGFSAAVYNEGRSFIKGFVNEKYILQSDPTSHHQTNEKGYFESQTYPYKLKIRVTGHKVTITVTPLYEWGDPFSYSYDLGNDYRGGYVGFASTGQNCRFWDFKVKDLGGNILIDTKDSLSSLERSSALFNVYSSNNAKYDGLIKEKFSTAFTLSEIGIMHKFDTSLVTNWWEQRDSFITTALSNTKQYRNFEMQVTCSGARNSVLSYYPMLVFGIKNPYKWVTSPDGGYSVCVYENGNTGLKGFVNKKYVDNIEVADRTNPSNRQGKGLFLGETQSYILKLRVEGYKATLTVLPTKTHGAGFSCSYYLGKDYEGGYLGFASTGQNCVFSDFYVKDLGNKIELNGVTGDIDMDGFVKASDLTMLRKMLLNCNSTFENHSADMNYDGNCDIVDLVAIKKLLAFIK